MARPFFTIGHSTRSISDFVHLIRDSNVRLVVDVRRVPRSRTNPQYNGDTLPATLSEVQIGYEHIAALGGLRGRKQDVPADLNAFWENKSFHNYADYAMSEEFQSGLARLRELGHATTCVTMCAEAVWWRCHRRIIADYLLAAGETVFHILGPHHVERAHITDGASFEAAGALTYPALDRSERAKTMHRDVN
jgi:uncharacterized protein (DUF488 family)